jgi:glycosyltransferase involved in cell wall biosynthesis
MAPSPDVTVIIATRDRRPLLAEAIASVRAQDGVTLELVVADDASGDDTAAWLHAELDGPGEHAVVLAEHAGRGPAANAALARATGRFVMFFDDDDRMAPGALARLAGTLDATPRAVAAVGGRLRRHEGRLRRTNHPARALTRHVHAEIVAGWGVTPGQVLVRAEELRAVGGLAPEAWPADDRALLLALARRGPFAFQPDAALEYRVHGGQVDKSGLQPLRDRLHAESIALLAPGRARRRARRAERAGGHWRAGDAAVQAGRRVRALGHYALVPLLAPRVGLSPLVWPPLARGAVAALRPGPPRGERPW